MKFVSNFFKIIFFTFQKRNKKDKAKRKPATRKTRKKEQKKNLIAKSEKRVMVMLMGRGPTWHLRMRDA
jgi:hypothetical protein